MHFYVDESGHTGQNLFDPEQPMLFYGVLSSRLNVDVVAAPHLERLKRSLSVPRLHAAELGNARLVSIAPELARLQRTLQLRFDLYRVAKPDHAVVSFFDQVFDQGMNPAVPWHCYWTPMRYPLVLKLAYLFDEDLAKRGWRARLSRDDELAESELVAICDELISRLGNIPDARSREILGEALTWARDHPKEIRYNAKSAEEAIVVAPNSVGFQSVILGITARVAKVRPRVVQITVDRQSQFNRAQRTMTEWYQKAKGSTIAIGPGMPEMDLRRIPDSPLRFASSLESPGLELVDIYLWTFKRVMEGKDVAAELYPLVRAQFNRGRTDEISLRGLEKRWGKWFAELPEPSAEQMERGKALLESIEANKRKAIANADRPG